MLSLSRSGEEKTTSASPSLSHWNVGSHGHRAIHSGSGAGALTTELSLQPLILLGAQGVVQTNQEGARLKMDGIDRLHHPRHLLPSHFRLGRGLRLGKGSGVRVSWTCRGRIRARNTPVSCKSVYKPTTTRNRGARPPSRNCVGAAPGSPRGCRPCARDGRKKRKRSRSWGPGPSEAVPGHSLPLPVSLGLHFLSFLQAW